MLEGHYTLHFALGQQVAEKLCIQNGIHLVKNILIITTKNLRSYNNLKITIYCLFELKMFLLKYIAIDDYFE